MVKFNVLWDNIIAALVAEATGIGVAANAIAKGAPGKSMPLAPPFVYVYCLPGEGNEDNAGNLTYGIAEISVFCGVAPSEEAEDSIVEAVKLTGRVRTALTNADLCADPMPPLFEEIGADYTCISFEYTSLYDSYEDLIIE